MRADTEFSCGMAGPNPVCFVPAGSESVLLAMAPGQLVAGVTGQDAFGNVARCNAVEGQFVKVTGKGSADAHLDCKTTFNSPSAYCAVCRY